MNFKITAISLIFIILAVLSFSIVMASLSLNTSLDIIREHIGENLPTTTPESTPVPTNVISKTGTECDRLPIPPYSINDDRCHQDCQAANIVWNNVGCPSLFPSSSVVKTINDECKNLPKPPYPINDAKCQTDCQYANIAWRNCGYDPI